MALVIGPVMPLPTLILSTERMGVISAAVPVKKASSAIYSISRGIPCSTIWMPRSRAICNAESRVMPGSTELPRGAVQRPIADDEYILTRSLADITFGVERDSFGVPIHDGFHLDELRVHIIGAGLGHCGKRVGSDAGPRRNADIHALLGVRA